MSTCREPVRSKWLISCDSCSLSNTSWTTLQRPRRTLLNCPSLCRWGRDSQLLLFIDCHSLLHNPHTCTNHTLQMRLVEMEESQNSISEATPTWMSSKYFYLMPSRFNLWIFRSKMFLRTFMRWLFEHVWSLRHCTLCLVRHSIQFYVLVYICISNCWVHRFERVDVSVMNEPCQASCGMKIWL